MEPDGTVTLTTGLQSNGQGHETTMAQVAADELGVRIEDVKVVQGDTAGTAYATGSYGSRTAVIGSGAIMRAAGDVRDKLLAIAAHLFEAAPDDLELGEGRISVLGSPEKSFTIREVATAAYWGPRPDDIDPALDRDAQLRPARDLLATRASPSSSRSTPRPARSRSSASSPSRTAARCSTRPSSRGR